VSVKKIYVGVIFVYSLYCSLNIENRIRILCIVFLKKKWVIVLSEDIFEVFILQGSNSGNYFSVGSKLQ